MADTVVGRLSSGKTPINNPMGYQGNAAIQTKCKGCQEEEELQKKEDVEGFQNEPDLQRKPIFESNGEQPEADVQTQLRKNPAIQTKCSTCGSGMISRATDENEENLQKKGEEGLSEAQTDIQTKSTDAPEEPGPDLQSRLNTSKGGGSSLSPDTESSMGSAFGADFSNVRVHTNSESVQMNQELNAQAFTHGSDIYFNEGKYDTNSNSGKHLLAHELTHTVQQGGAVRTKPENLSTTNEPVIQRKSWLQKKIESGLNWAAERAIPGYTLLNVILGKNLITGASVARTGVNLIEGFMDLTPVIGKILFNELKEAKSLTEAGVWVEKKMAKFGINFDDISKRLKLMWDEMSIWKGIDGNVKVFKKYFGKIIGKIIAFTGVVNEKVKELRFEGFMRLVGAHELLATIKKNKAAFKRAVDNPKLILSGFIKALKKGFSNFKNNFKVHFKNALFGWLFGKAAEMGVEIPKKFDLPNLFQFVAQLTGATYQNIRMQVVKRLGPKGEKIIGYMEKGAGLVKALVTKGPIALWEKVKTSIGDLKTMLFGKIAALVSGEIVKQAIIKLVSMLNPAGAIFQLVLGVYRVIKFFIDWWETIRNVATGILNSIVKVALGQFDGATTFIEKILAKGMTLVIAFLANIFGLGGIVTKVKKLIKTISKPIQKAIGKVINWIVKKGKKLFKSGKAKVKGAITGLFKWLKKKKKFKAKNGEEHKIFFKKKGKKLGTMVASETPFELKDHIAKRKKAKPKLKDGQAALLDAALILSNQLIAKFDLFAKEEEKGKNPADISSDVDTTLAEIAEKLKDGGLFDAGGDLPPTKVTFAMANGKSKTITASPLTKIPGNTQGQDSTSGLSPKGEALKKAAHEAPSQTAKDTKSRDWSHVHLLSHLLHGPYTLWNIVIANTAVNSALAKFEHGTQRGAGSNFAKKSLKDNYIYHYEVNVKYLSAEDIKDKNKAVIGNKSDYPDKIYLTIKRKAAMSDNWEAVAGGTAIDPAMDLDEFKSLDLAHTKKIDSHGVVPKGDPAAMVAGKLATLIGQIKGYITGRKDQTPPKSYNWDDFRSRRDIRMFKKTAPTAWEKLRTEYIKIKTEIDNK